MSRVQRNVIFTYKIFLEYFQHQQLDTDFIQSKPGVKSVSFAKDSALAQLGPNCCSWFHHISKSQNKISRTWVWKFLLLLFLIYSSHLQNSKQNCKCLCVKNCGPKCIEKTTPYIYSIFKMTRNFLLNHLWWWIYVRFENCEIPIDSQSVVPQPSCKVALWLGNRQNLGHSGFSLHQNVLFFISQFHCIWSIWAPSKTM